MAQKKSILETFKNDGNYLNVRTCIPLLRVTLNIGTLFAIICTIINLIISVVHPPPFYNSFSHPLPLSPPSLLRKQSVWDGKGRERGERGERGEGSLFIFYTLVQKHKTIIFGFHAFLCRRKKKAEGQSPKKFFSVNF